MKKQFLMLIAFVALLLGCNGKNEDGGNNGSTPNNAGPQASEFGAFFSQTFAGKSGDAVVDILNGLVHPEVGVFLIYKPGALPVAKPCKTAAQIKELMPPIMDNFGNIKYPVQQGELPYYDCESFDKQGSFFKEMSGGDAIVKTYENMKEMLYVDIAPAEMELAKKSDSMTTHVFMSTEAGLQLSFAKIDGKWYIIAIDIAQFDCGA